METWQYRFDEQFNIRRGDDVFAIPLTPQQIKSFISQELEKVEKEWKQALAQMREAFDSSLEKAREEGRQEGETAKMKFWEGNPKAVALAERTRIISLIQQTDIILCSEHGPDNFKKDCLHCAKSAGCVYFQDKILFRIPLKEKINENK